ncbi:hypothetical protein [Pseudomonas cichorii]|uniref:Uncharacterized protein n=1 Tax=Pseudomonas cichorii TaxID=36746 RepID=A0ABQ1DT13_PSECI|nr:hypothetical protein [Pseudomonas cichorii]AHF66013.1 hypothetical protein PCH70_08600 [Pseudomonas cichorii JBC1]QVE17979.1 hypothetical protein KGD89_04260 [Pseudomonas cichorii]GFM94168.1 hypothetical protein PSCICP_41400 [Pseudomonas cichorii]SDP00334.1 hypothetical protein SAMN05216599_116131 [Pseudomonas cichorii]
MSKKTVQNLESIASEACDQLECASYQISWLNSIAWAITQALENNRPENALRLAEAAQYLTDDYKYQLEGEVKSLAERLGESEIRA